VIGGGGFQEDDAFAVACAHLFQQGDFLRSRARRLGKLDRAVRRRPERVEHLLANLETLFAQVVAVDLEYVENHDRLADGFAVQHQIGAELCEAIGHGLGKGDHETAPVDAFRNAVLVAQQPALTVELFLREPGRFLDEAVGFMVLDRVQQAGEEPGYPAGFNCVREADASVGWGVALGHLLGDELAEDGFCCAPRNGVGGLSPGL